MVFTLRNRHIIAAVPRQKGCHHNAWQPQDTDGSRSEVLNCWIWNHLLTVQITSINSQIKIWIKDMPQQDVHLNVYTYIYILFTLHVFFCICIYIYTYDFLHKIVACLRSFTNPYVFHPNFSAACLAKSPRIITSWDAQRFSGNDLMLYKAQHHQLPWK